MPTAKPTTAAIPITCHGLSRTKPSVRLPYKTAVSPIWRPYCEAESRSCDAPSATALWAAALHAAHPTLDGLIWTSKRCDPDQALVLFGDRVTANDLAPMSTQRVVATSSLWAAVQAFGKRAGVRVTR